MGRDGRVQTIMANGKPLLKDKQKKKKDRKPTISQLKHKLDAIFSQYIRQKYAKDGKVACFTCSRIGHIKEMQCGHFVSRSYLATRFDERNVRVQCVGCNVFGGGKVAIFAINLEKEKKGIVQELYRKSQEITKYYPYSDKIKEYEEKLKNL